LNYFTCESKKIVNFLDEIYKTTSLDDTLKYIKDKPIFNLLINKKYEDFKEILYFQENLKQLFFELENRLFFELVLNMFYLFIK
jgi:hypothetical protein